MPGIWGRRRLDSPGEILGDLQLARAPGRPGPLDRVNFVSAAFLVARDSRLGGWKEVGGIFTKSTSPGLYRCVLDFSGDPERPLPRTLLKDLPKLLPGVGARAGLWGFQARDFPTTCPGLWKARAFFFFYIFFLFAQVLFRLDDSTYPSPAIV